MRYCLLGNALNFHEVVIVYNARQKSWPVYKIKYLFPVIYVRVYSPLYESFAESKVEVIVQ
jgi:hypothetical protein